jgi:hypothetical protein
MPDQDNDIPRPIREQLEERALYAQALDRSTPVIALNGTAFPSLQQWYFGLPPKEGVTLEQLEALADQINAICDSAYALFTDREREGMPLYEIDEFGLAILHDSPPRV